MTKQGMIKVLESRIEEMKTFDLTFKETLQGVQEQANELAIAFDVNALSQDKSVRSHIRKRTQQVNNVITRFKRDLTKAIEAVETEAVEVEAVETEAVEVEAVETEAVEV